MSTMKIRAVDGENDWEFGFGLSSYRFAESAIEENIKTSLQCWLNDCFWRLDFGVDWANLLGSKNPAGQAGIILQCREVIVSSFGVTRVNSVSASIDSLTRALSVQYNINTIYSRNNSGIVTLTSS